MAKPRMDSVVKVSRPKFAITRQFKNQFGIVIGIIPENSKIYYRVRLNSGKEIVFERSEISA